MYNESLISTVIYIDESVEWETYTLFVISFQIQVTVLSINLRENISITHGIEIRFHKKGYAYQRKNMKTRQYRSLPRFKPNLKTRSK